MQLRQHLSFITIFVVFFGLTWVIANVMSGFASTLGLFIRPSWMFYVGAISCMGVFSLFFLRTFRGFFLLYAANRPVISLSKDLTGFRPTESPFVAHTQAGLVATYRVSLSLAEGTKKAGPRRAIEMFLRRPILSTFLSEIIPKTPVIYAIHPDNHDQLGSLLGFENAHLASLNARGPIYLDVTIAVQNLEEATEILEEETNIEPLPIVSFGGSFFGAGFYEQGGIVSERLVKGLGSPGVVRLLTGDMVVLEFFEYDSAFGTEPPSTMYQELQIHLHRPVGLQQASVTISPSEIKRFDKVLSLEKAYPYGWKSRATRDRIEKKMSLLPHLEQKVEHLAGPRFIKQHLWISLQSDDNPRVIANKAIQFLSARYHIDARTMTPTRALRAYVAGAPGGHRFGPDRIGGYGTPFDHEDVGNILEAVKNWQGHRDPAIVFTDDANRAVGFNLFAAGNNYNALLTGESGSGKSVFLNGYVVGHLAANPYNRAIVVEYGGSLEAPTRMAGGLCFRHQDKGSLKLSPFPTVPPLLTPEEFAEIYLDQDYETYIQDRAFLRRELNLQSLEFVLGSLAHRINFRRTAVFEELWFNLLANVDLSESVKTIIETGIAWLNNQAEQPNLAEIKNHAITDLTNVLIELGAICNTNPFIGQSEHDFFSTRIVNFDLDGYGTADRPIIFGLVTLLIQNIFATPQVGKTLIIFDELFLFLEIPGVGTMLESVQRVARKYGVALILSTQAPNDFKSRPTLIENANTHIVMRLQGVDLDSRWKLRSPEIIRRAAEAEPAADVGYSSVHIGMTLGDGVIEIPLRYHLSPVAYYAFTSKKSEKNLLRLACTVTGTMTNDQPDFGAFAVLIHEDEPQKLISIGSAEFFKTMEAHLLPNYRGLQGNIHMLLRDTDGSPLLKLFIDGDRAAFESVCADPKKIQDLFHGGAV